MDVIVPCSDLQQGLYRGPFTLMSSARAVKYLRQLVIAGDLFSCGLVPK